jgi:hypothetical protein
MSLYKFCSLVTPRPVFQNCPESNKIHSYHSWLDGEECWSDLKLQVLSSLRVICSFGLLLNFDIIASMN